MIDASEARAAIDASFDALKEALCVGDYRVTVHLGRCESDDHMADCSLDPAYMKAAFRIDPAKHDDGVEVVDSLRHEMLHVVLGEFDLLHDLARDAASDEFRHAVDATFNLAVERTIVRLERVMDRAGLTAAHFLGRDPSTDETQD